MKKSNIVTFENSKFDIKLQNVEFLSRFMIVWINIAISKINVLKILFRWTCELYYDESRKNGKIGGEKIINMNAWNMNRYIV